MVGLGIAITGMSVGILVAEFLRHRRAPLAVYGWLGAATLILAELLMFRGIQSVATYFTPLAWTAYILLADASVRSLTGHSRLHDDPLSFLGVALLSIPLWLIFEAYNLRLANWTYVGVPVNWAGALVGYGWSFATITPAVFETADLIEAFGWFGPSEPVEFPPAGRRGMIFLGVTCLSLPLLVPQHAAAYLFVLVWIGFIFLLDPINFSRGLPSLLGDLASGRRGRLYSLFIAGWVCGWLWEFWNYWALAKWHYIFPMAQGWKIFEMPAPGYLGFLPFALECFVMYTAVSHVLEKAVALNRSPRRPPETNPTARLPPD
jgi:hypothetical protein